MANRGLEQHIAVFGESGSGKTVLVSSFYGAAQQQPNDRLFDVFATDVGLGNRLLHNYLGMKKSAKVPSTNRFGATSYSFMLKMKKQASPSSGKKPSSNSATLVWHDYPGEWFEKDATGLEAARRIETFRDLLSSDVAILLVDGQKLLDHQGEEERYLKSLFTGIRTGLGALEDDLLPDGKPLVRFPRIWVLALSKSDLLPSTTVVDFRDLIIEKSIDDLEELRRALSKFVAVSEALSVGEDFLLLSSAKFEPGKIELSTRVGVELIPPLAAILPFERHLRWAKTIKNGAKLVAPVVTDLLRGVTSLSLLLKEARSKAPSKIAVLLALIPIKTIDAAVQMADDLFARLSDDSVAKSDGILAVLARFQRDLDDAEKRKVLLRCRR